MLSDLDQIRAWTTGTYREAEQSRLAAACRRAEEPPERPEPAASMPEPVRVPEATG